ncbi:MAG: SMI1/KNR4 family protein [Lachnospiraceae bacterium]|jgi:hypothetical protein|nr:SMI1/KNR4 family protein [Lachnospiraceae bacterium]
MSIVQKLQSIGCKLNGNYEEEVELAEEKLGISFATDFKEYLVNFGQITLESDELTGVIGPEYLNVVNATSQQRQYILPKYSDMYVIENLGMDGIVIWQKSNGEVYQTVPQGIPEKIYNNFEEYLVNEIL